VTFNSDPIRIDTKREITEKQPPRSEAHTGPRPAQPTAFSRAPLVIAPSERTEQLARPRKVTPKVPMQTAVAFGRTVHVDDGNKERVEHCFECVCIHFDAAGNTRAWSSKSSVGPECGDD
jgi:hypothetical protein